MKLLVLNGPNLNLLGLREPEIYGNKTYSDLVCLIKEYCSKKGIYVEIKQTNHEGEMLDLMQDAYNRGFDSLVINPAAYTHTSIALLDCLNTIKIPTVEIHISKVSSREDFRQISYIRSACIKTIEGEGFDGYIHAIKELEDYHAGNDKKR